MSETIGNTSGESADKRTKALEGIFGNVGDLIRVAQEQGHAYTRIIDLPDAVIEEQYQLRHPTDEATSA